MKVLLALALAAALTGCTTTTAVLLPGEDGKTGALVVNPGPSETVVDQAYAAAAVRTAGGTAHVRFLPREEVEKRYGATLAAEPAGPARFTLYFVSGTSELTEESRALLPTVLEAFTSRSPARVFIIGHTDSVGGDDLNLQLSLERAREVEKLMRASSAAFGTIEVRGFGKNDPLVPTPENVPEPRNRRVEILIL